VAAELTHPTGCVAPAPRCARRASKVKSVATTLLDAAPDSIDRPAAAQALVEGIALGSYKFLRYKGEAKPSQLRGGEARRARRRASPAAVDRGARIAVAVTWARDLVNEPADAKSPDDIANLAKKLASGELLKAQVLSGAQLERARLGGVIGSARAPTGPPASSSSRTSRWARDHARPWSGKGVVFDSGGLSIKTASGMETMKTDMGGARP